MPTHLVLLPGLDGTGELFADFVAALPQSWVATTVAYPSDKFLPYSGLRSLVSAAVPPERFLLVAESFSTPLALAYAAAKPPNLAALVICAGFVRSPVGAWSGIVRTFGKSWFFRLRSPRRILEYFLVGEHASPELHQRLRCVLSGVCPEVLSSRLQAVLDCDARDDLRLTTVPLMYLRATNDRLLSSTCQDEFLRVRPDILVKSVPGPHLLLQREPQMAAELIASFAAGLVSA